jgi:hypothetical protein
MKIKDIITESVIAEVDANITHHYQTDKKRVTVDNSWDKVRSLARRYAEETKKNNRFTYTSAFKYFIIRCKALMGNTFDEKFCRDRFDEQWQKYGNPPPKTGEKQKEKVVDKPRGKAVFKLPGDYDAIDYN